MTNPANDDLASIWQQAQKQHPEANFLQSPTWSHANELIGHHTVILHSKADAAEFFWCSMIIKNAKRGRYLEIPGGPLFDWQNLALREKIFTKISQVAKKEKCVFIRLRPQLPATAENLQILEQLGCEKAPMHLHAEHTVMLDLTQSEDKLLKSMRRQTRYEVRRASKLGLTVAWHDDISTFRAFHTVQTATAARQHFVPPDLKTLLAERTAFTANGQHHARLYVVSTPDSHDPIAYGLILIDGQEAEYFEAASTELNYKLPGAYALLWQAMRDLKADGLTRFNLWGIAPPGEKHHRYAGVTTFKTGFGGEIVEFVPAHDIVIRPLRYQINKLIETIRRKRRKLS